jgi:hypothetical protein
MAYTSGSANDMAAVRTAIFTFCVANGWTLNSAGNILSKNGAFFWLVSTTSSSPQSLVIRGGTGINGSNALTGQAVGFAAMTRVAYAASDPAFPLIYEIHVLSNPDEVYVVINYNVDLYQYLSFGKSNVLGLPSTATGAWFSASSAGYSINGSSYVTMTITNAATTYYPAPGLFWAENGAGSSSATPEPAVNVPGNSFIHTDLDGRGWSGGYYQGNLASSLGGIRSLLQVLPNAWNGEAVLIPFPIYQPYQAFTKTALVADLSHIRHMRIDNHTPGDIITLGADKWKVYPWLKKVITSRNGPSADNTGAQGSGTLGYAIRYTGT